VWTHLYSAFVTLYFCSLCLRACWPGFFLR